MGKGKIVCSYKKGYTEIDGNGYGQIIIDTCRHESTCSGKGV